MVVFRLALFGLALLAVSLACASVGPAAAATCSRSVQATWQGAADKAAVRTIVKNESSNDFNVVISSDDDQGSQGLVNRGGSLDYRIGVARPAVPQTFEVSIEITRPDDAKTEITCVYWVEYGKASATSFYSTWREIAPICKNIAAVCPGCAIACRKFWGNDGRWRTEFTISD